MYPDSSIYIAEDEDLRPLPPLTDRQAECLIYLFNYFAEHRYYPTQREIAKQMNLKTNSAVTFLEPLHKKGYLEKEPGRSRNIHLTKSALIKLKLMNMVKNKNNEQG